VCAASARDHREAVGLFGNEAIDDDRAGMVDHRLNRRHRARLSCVDAHALPAVSLSELHEIGQRCPNRSSNSGSRRSVPAIGAPCPSIRCSSTKILTGRRYCEAVPSSWMFIWIEASPAMSITSASGCADLHADRGGQAVAHRAEPARGQPAGWAPSKWKCCAAHIWCWPTSVVIDRITVLGQLRSSRSTAYCGLIASLSVRIASRLLRARQPSICVHQAGERRCRLAALASLPARDHAAAARGRNRR